MHLESRKASIEQMVYGTRYEDIRSGITIFNAEIATLKMVDASLFSVNNTLEQIIEIIPPGIEVTFLQYSDADLWFEIVGVADSRETLLELKQSFEEATFISDVVAPISNFDAKEEISFTMKLNLNFSELTPYATESNS